MPSEATNAGHVPLAEAFITLPAPLHQLHKHASSSGNKCASGPCASGWRGPRWVIIAAWGCCSCGGEQCCGLGGRLALAHCLF